MDVKQLARKARTLWPDSRYNRKAWLRSVLWLGDRWLLSQPVGRKA